MRRVASEDAQVAHMRYHMGLCSLAPILRFQLSAHDLQSERVWNHTIWGLDTFGETGGCGPACCGSEGGMTREGGAYPSCPSAASRWWPLPACAPTPCSFRPLLLSMPI